MTPLRLGAVGYLNARPLVYGLDRVPGLTLRFDVPSECARLLQAGQIDLGLIPSIEYLRGEGYSIVPGLAIASRGPVASVALYTTRPIADVRSIVMDTSSRTSVALVRVLCARLFKIQPTIEVHGPHLEQMLARGDAALLIGDNSLLLDHTSLQVGPFEGGGRHAAEGRHVEKIDLGEAWTSMTGLPFVWAFWAGRAGAVGPADCRMLQIARDHGVEQTEEIARQYFHHAPQYSERGASYLRENIKYYLNGDERTGLGLFYQYAAELGLVPAGRSTDYYASV
jgi:chorismate dehydratase